MRKNCLCPMHWEDGGGNDMTQLSDFVSRTIFEGRGKKWTVYII